MEPNGRLADIHVESTADFELNAIHRCSPHGRHRLPALLSDLDRERAGSAASGCASLLRNPQRWRTCGHACPGAAGQAYGYESISSKQKFILSEQDSFDPPGFFVGACFAGLYQFEKQNPSFGEGLKG